MPSALRCCPGRVLACLAALMAFGPIGLARQPAAEVESFEWLPAFTPAFTGSFVMNNHGDFGGLTTTGAAMRVNGQVSPSFGAMSTSLLPTVSDMNDSPTIVGLRPGLGATPPMGFRLDQLASFTLGTSHAHWTGINNAGTIVGHYFGNSPVHPGRAFRINLFGEMTILDEDFKPRGIDAKGRIYGVNTAGDSGFFMKDGDSPLVNLGAFGGEFFSIRFVSEKGDFAGEVLNDQGASSKAFAYIDGEGHVFPRDPGALTAIARSVTRAGQVVGMDFTEQLPRPVWVQRGQTRSMLRDLAAPVLGYTPNIEFVVAGSERGWILGLGIDPSVNELRLFRCKLRDEDPDRDGDGLANDWEINGIPYTDSKGVQRRYMLPGADPDRKNLYVEVDGGSIPLSDEAIARLEFAFDIAPVQTPGGSPGVRLHIQKDEFNIPLPNSVVLAPSAFPANFATIKQERFGTASERADPDAAALLAAKAKAFRYCIVYDGLEFAPMVRKYTGLAELHGNDFLIDLIDPIFSDGVRDADEAAGVFMHELGHTLGLRHGGSDDFHGKPNYVSVMNYVLAVPRPWCAKFWRLDFSREDLPTLDEQLLSEIAGIPSAQYRGVFMPYGVGPEAQRSFRLVKLAGIRTNFNGDGAIGGFVEADLNFIGPAAQIPGVELPTPGQALPGHNDWFNLQYAIPEGATLGDGEIAEGCPSPESILFVEQNVPAPCVADINGDTFIGFADLNEVISRFNAAVGEALFDAAVDIDYDGLIGFSDLNIILSQFNTACPDGVDPCKKGPEPTLGGDPCKDPEPTGS